MSMLEAKTVKIVKTPDVCGGAARIEGTRIRVVDIIAHQRMGKSPEEIAELFRDSVDLGDVHAALSYYYKHREEIEREEAETREVVRQAMKAHPSKIKESA